MGYALELFFDKESEEKIEEIWKVLYDKGLSKYMYESNSRPHITLNVYNDKDLPTDKFIKTAKEYIKDLDRFKLILSHVGIFNTNEGVVFLEPKVTADLLKLHSDLRNYMSDFEEFEWPYYHPDKWIPHCAMALNIGKDRVLESIKLINEMFSPMEVSINNIGIVKFKPEEYIEIIELN